MAAINPSTSKLWLRLVTRCSILFRKKKKIKMVFLTFLSILSLLFFFSISFILLAILWCEIFETSILIIVSWRIPRKKERKREDYAFWLRIDWWIIDCLNRRHENLREILIFNEQGFRNRIDARSNRLQGPVLSGRKIFYQTIKLISIIYNIVKFV